MQGSPCVQVPAAHAGHPVMWRTLGLEGLTLKSTVLCPPRFTETQSLPEVGILSSIFTTHTRAPDRNNPTPMLGTSPPASEHPGGGKALRAAERWSPRDCAHT